MTGSSVISEHTEMTETKLNCENDMKSVDLEMRGHPGMGDPSGIWMLDRRIPVPGRPDSTPRTPGKHNPLQSAQRPEARKYVSAYMSLPLRKAYSGIVTALDPAEQDLERPQAVGCPQTRYEKAILVSRLLDIGTVEPLSK